jgi:predicted PolB exonuclease-like 3'-5' exonuclease
MKWIHGIANVQVCTTKCQQVPMKEMTYVVHHLQLQKNFNLVYLHHHSHKRRKKKTEENIEGLLQQVVENSTIIISTFQQFTKLLKNMDINFAALLEKF